MQIQIEIREVYGCPKVYPICERARTFAEIARTKTLGFETIKSIQKLGVEIEITSCPSVFSNFVEALCNQQQIG